MELSQQTEGVSRVHANTAARQNPQPSAVTFAGLKQVVHDRLRNRHKLRGTSLTKSGEKVDLLEILDYSLRLLVKDGPAHYSQLLSELNARFANPVANRKRLARWLKILVDEGILQKDSQRRYSLAIPCEPTFEELDQLQPQKVLESASRRIETELARLREEVRTGLAPLREEVRELRAALSFFLRLANERGDSATKPGPNRQPPEA